MHEVELAAFVAVAEQRHFGRAAASQYVVVSTLSRRLSSLERATGLVLAVRTAQSVRLTEQGEAFLPEAHRLLSDLDRTRRAARRISQSARRPTANAPATSTRAG